MIKRLVPLLPSWVHTVTVKWEDDGEDAAQAEYDAKYRLLNLTICSGWLSQSKGAGDPRMPRQRDAAKAGDERWSAIVHEVLHAPFAPLHDLYHDLIEAAEMDETAQKLAKNAWNHALEGAVMDMERVLAPYLDKLK